uniref:G domain-containing protein n=1 Tax=Clytia hemisphaerica TaxID=252671 RepID=A0A7M5XF89_9CNID
MPGGKRKTEDTENLISKKPYSADANIKSKFELMAESFEENDQSNIEQIDSDKAPYVVLVGNVGSGKSTIVEKLTGEKGRSSSSAESATRAAEYFWTPDQRLLIADTPGTNPRKDKLGHNKEIAAALSYQEVSKFLIVAKAHVRMDQTISEIKQYSDRFVELPDDLVGVMVTHMDIHKEWDESEMKNVLNERFEIPVVIFSGSHNIADEVNRRIIDTCQTSYRIDVGCRLYNEYFRIEESNIKILKITNEFVRRFKQIRKGFVKKLALCSQLDRANAIFEFLTFFKEKQLETGKAEMICNLKLNFKGENGDLQKGFLINMENQANAVMSDLRKEAAF